MDYLIYGFSKSSKISLSYVVVSEAVKKLEQLHLSGPTAGRFLAETVAAVALTSAELKNDDERISIQTKVDGPIGGSFSDASKNGNLRGYTLKKILNEFDDQKDIQLNCALGKFGELTFIKSNSKGILSQNTINCDPLDMRHGLARYYNEATNQPTAIEIAAISEDYAIKRASAVKVTKTEPCDSELFISILEKFNSGLVKNSISEQLDITGLSKLLGIEDLEIFEHRFLTAKCTCNREKVLYSVSCLSKEELNEILEKKELPEVTCHFCSKSYRVTTEEVANMLRKIK